MDRVSDILGRTMRRLDKPQAALAWLEGAWPGIAGAVLASHTKPVHCEAGCLEIAVETGSWQREIRDLQGELCRRINDAWGGTLVREVKLRAAGKQLPRAADVLHTPFVRRPPAR